MTNHLSHFKAIDVQLHSYSALWRNQPFKETPCWVRDSPELSLFLTTISASQVESAQADDEALWQLFAEVMPELCHALRSVCELPRSPALAVSEPPAHVPGRKWSQIAHFSRAIGPTSTPTLEWCSGKAHLSRHLCRQWGQAATALEIDASLIKDAERLAEKEPLPLSLQQCDVLTTDTGFYLAADLHAIALHACGGLHRKLLSDAVEYRVQRISLSPCCYHKFLGGGFTALSTAGRQSNVQPEVQQLRTAVRQNTTAGTAEKQKHRQMQSWKLGFDALQRHLRQQDQYLPTPPLSVKILRGDFQDFCAALAAASQLRLPPETDYQRFEAIGAARYLEVQRQELVRELFRRPLELWLVLDEILFLEDAGYTCSLRQFCDATITPRNLIIDARR